MSIMVLSEGETGGNNTCNSTLVVDSMYIKVVNDNY